MPRWNFSRPERTFAGYIFDCDGTLADTMPIHHRAWCDALRASGAAFEFDWPLFVSRAGMSLEQTVVELGEQFQLALDPQQVAAQQRRRYAELEGGVQPIFEVLEFARQIARTHPVSVASGSRRDNVERTLRLIGAEDLFSVIVTPEDVDRGKPHPDMFLLAAEKMGVAPESCVVFEDAELGFEAARRARMALVRIESAET